MSHFLVELRLISSSQFDACPECCEGKPLEPLFYIYDTCLGVQGIKFF
jgi:hypothetical protein